MFVSLMQRPKPPVGWTEFKAWLFDLPDDERLYVRRWIARYVNRWGQIPVLSSFRQSKALDQRPSADGDPLR
jgi:hypothetical protein